jgi:hypothetical protein
MFSEYRMIEDQQPSVQCVARPGMGFGLIAETMWQVSRPADRLVTSSKVVGIIPGLG